MRGLPELEELFTKYGLKIKTQPFHHQIAGFFASKGVEYFAQLGEQGTGKTWILINEAAVLFKMGEIDRVLVIAPKGVDSNWQKDELPKHMPEGVVYTMALWRSKYRVKQRIAVNKMLGKQTATFSFEEAENPPDQGFKWLLMNWDAISTDKGFGVALEFLGDGAKTMVICDEAHKVKKHTSKRAQALFKMKKFAAYRRIATGTPITNSPFDMFGPFSFLSADIMGTDSYASFKSEYAKMLNPTSPLYQSLLQKMEAQLMAKGISEERAKKAAENRIPKLVEKDAGGRPMYKNLDRLHDRVQPFSFRVLKKECLDLPEKIYKKVYFDMTEEQEEVYDEARDNLRLTLDAETITNLSALTVALKLSQITSGFFIETAEKLTHRIPGDNPKLMAFIDLMDDMEEEKVIVWAHLREEIRDIRKACVDLGLDYVEYHGGIGDQQRIKAIEDFQNGSAQVFIGHPKSGGTGLTLHAASQVVYYSNSYSMEARVQSEDRAHRIGQKNIVTYWDLIASGTIEERIIQVLQDKTDLAAVINGDLLK